MNKPFTIWLTGLSGSGKSTVADALTKALSDRGAAVERLDGDRLRQSMTAKLGFSPEDRNKNIEIAGDMAKQFNAEDKSVVATFITPYQVQREGLRQKINDLVLVFVNTPLEVCEQRDVKGLYQKARAGEIESFTGISDIYEPPVDPEVELETVEATVENNVAKIISYLEDKKYI